MPLDDDLTLRSISTVDQRSAAITDAYSGTSLPKLIIRYETLGPLYLCYLVSKAKQAKAEQTAKWFPLSDVTLENCIRNLASITQI